MTLHIQLKGFVDRHGVDKLQSPYLSAYMADERMFANPDCRHLKKLFKQMVAYDHVKQMVHTWNKSRPSVNTYAPIYVGSERDDINYAIDCIGYALGKIDDVTTVSHNADEITQSVNLEDDTVEYISHGSSDNIGTLIPAVMAQPVHRHLNAIANDEGSVIEFVRSEMCEPDADDIRKKISGEQIDGVALAMRQMLDGRAFILGDMTGVGKGRQLAMLLKWAQRHGEKPVFVTEKSTLFNDLYRDLKDIGYADMRPFILNSDSNACITDSFGHIVYSLPSPDEMEEFKSTGSLPVGYDFLLMTYSQVNKDPAISWKPEAVLKACTGTYLILDESHNASGIDSNTGVFFRQAVEASSAVCFASATYAKYPSSMPIYALKTAMGYANIPSSDLLEIISHGGPILQEVMAQGLVESGSMIRRQRDMSEVVRILDIPTDKLVVDSLRNSYDRVIALIDDIRDFHKSYLETYINSLDPVAVLQSKCKTGAREKWVENVCCLKDWKPQLRLAPTIRQLIFALKTDFAVEKTLEEVRAGRKPIIQVSRTMESPISRLMKPGDTCDSPDFALVLKSCIDDIFQYEAAGKTVTKIGKKDHYKSYSATCTYQLSDVINYFNSPEWLNSGIPNANETAQMAQDCYDLLLKNISTTITGLPLSPIDYFVQRLTDEGLKVGELTQRSIHLVYKDIKSGPNSRVSCVSRKTPNKKQLAADFNNGKIDVLIGNRVMASGISLHSSEGFADTRPRTVITWEQQDSADTQTQFDGRADRTGQLSHCKYIVLSSPVPAELRYLMMNSRKQRSLNANVEANQGRNSLCVDMFNKYGAKVINEFADDNPELAEVVMSLYISNRKSSNVLTDSKYAQYVSVFMRDLGLLVCADQEKILDDVVSRYHQLMDRLNDNGENDIQATVLPLQANLKKRTVFVKGKANASSPFAREANIDEYEVNVIRKPLSSAEIREYMTTLRDENYLRPKIKKASKEKRKNIEDYYSELRTRALRQLAQLTSSSSYTPSRIQALEKRANNYDRMKMEITEVYQRQDTLLSRLRYFQIGSTYSIPSTIIAEGQVDDPAYAAKIPVGIFMGYQVFGDKYIPSRIMAVFAVSDSRSIVRIPMSENDSLETIMRQSGLGVSLTRNSMINLNNWDTMIAHNNRETAYIITGNILCGIAKCKQCLKSVYKSKMSRLVSAMAMGRMVKYTDIHGNICIGYMLPRIFSPKIFFSNITI